MRKLLKRWYIWLGLILLLGLAGSVVLIYVNPGRITQANFDRIQNGMSLQEVEAILGQPSSSLWMRIHRWQHGPNAIIVVFREGKAADKNSHFASAWETLKWHAKKGAAKFGVKWD